MVSIQLLNKMRAHYKENSKEFEKKHPGKYILYESLYAGITHTLFRTKWGVRKATRKYKGYYGPTFEIIKIPKKGLLKKLFG